MGPKTGRLSRRVRPVGTAKGRAPTVERLTISSGGGYEQVFGYARAVRFGDQIHVSGTCAPPEHEASDTYTQARAALAIIDKALRDAGSSFADVVRTVVFVVDMGESDEVARAHREIFGAIRPASTMVQVSGLLRPWQRVEIEAYAILGSARVLP